MEIIRTIDWMKQTSRAARDSGRSIGFVPTMGALHEGHLSLVKAAMATHKPVVVSIFVNPTQFGPREDFARYPRDLGRDAALLELENPDYLFAPEPEEIYPAGFRTYVNVEGLGDRLEGRVRPGHFRGVTTVVLKLLEIVRPHTAFLGRKDAQQARIIKQMALDLNLDTDISVQPLIREPDGVAWSSRNVYLTAEGRQGARSLSRALISAASAITAGERSASAIVQAARQVLAEEPLVQIDYVELVDEENLEPVLLLGRACLLLIAANVGDPRTGKQLTRLIDNMLITPDAVGKFQVTL